MKVTGGIKPVSDAENEIENRRTAFIENIGA